MALVMIGLMIVLVAAAVGYVIFNRKRHFQNFNQAFDWLGQSKPYLLNGRQFNGQFMGRDVTIQCYGRGRQRGLCLDFNIRATHNFQLVVGSRSGLGTMLQKIVGQEEILGTALNHELLTLNSDQKEIARKFVNEANNQASIEFLTQSFTQFEIRALRFEKNSTFFSIRYPVQQVFNSEYSKRIVENLVSLTDSADGGPIVAEAIANAGVVKTITVNEAEETDLQNAASAASSTSPKPNYNMSNVSANDRLVVADVVEIPHENACTIVQDDFDADFSFDEDQPSVISPEIIED